NKCYYHENSKTQWRNVCLRLPLSLEAPGLVATARPWLNGFTRSHKNAATPSLSSWTSKTSICPLLDEPVPAAMGNYSKPHTKVWAAKIDSCDGSVYVTPEYNHGINGALKNAIDFLYREWNNKAAGFVGYGGAGRCASRVAVARGDGLPPGRDRAEPGPALAH